MAHTVTSDSIVMLPNDVSSPPPPYIHLHHTLIWDLACWTHSTGYFDSSASLK